MMARLRDSLRVLFGRARFEREMDEELRGHIEMMTADLVGRGVPRPEATRRARASFGAVDGFKQDARDARGVEWTDAVGRELRHTVRSLRRSPGYAAVALLTLAIGIGGTTAIFSLIDGLLFRPLPFREPDRLLNLFVAAHESAKDPVNPFPWSYPKYLAMQRAVTSYEAMAGFSTSDANLVEGEPERVRLEFVSGDYFRLLGIGPALGRMFTRADDSIPKAHPVVVLSHGLWLRRFGADSAVIGRIITLGTSRLTVVGIAPRGFGGLSNGVDLWLPMMMSPVFEYGEILVEAQNHWFGVVARLKPGATLAGARAEMATVGRQVDSQFRGSDQAVSWSATAEPLASIRVDPAIGQASWVLFAATGVVLLIGAINLANLLLIRANGRRRELSVRAALGAGRGAIVRHVMMESVLLSAVGGLLGVGLARLAGPAIASLWPRSAGGPGGTSYLFDATSTMDSRVLLFALAATVVTGLAVGLWPAWRAAQQPVAGSLHDVRVTTGGGRIGRWGAAQALVLAEASLAVALVTGAVLLVRSLSKLTTLDLGFRSENVLTFRVSPGATGLAGRDPAQFRILALAALRTIPGVETAGTDLCPPLEGPCAGSVVTGVDDQIFTGGGLNRGIGVHYVSPGFLETLRIPVVAGRGFDDRDGPGMPRAVLVNENAAKRLWPGQNPIGKRLRVATAYFHGGDSAIAVIGVVGNVRYASADQPAALDVYTPALQSGFARSAFLIRTTGNPLGIVEAARKAIRSVDPDLPIYSVRTMDEIGRIATGRIRFATTLLSAFAAMALLLAAIGVYGVLAYSVTERAREIAVRIALGAERSEVIRLVLRQGMTPIALGLVIGLGGALAGSRALQGLLYGIEPGDPASFGAGALALGAAGLLASWLPARRAAGLDPNRVLREE